MVFCLVSEEYTFVFMLCLHFLIPFTVVSFSCSFSHSVANDVPENSIMLKRCRRRRQAQCTTRSASIAWMDGCLHTQTSWAVLCLTWSKQKFHNKQSIEDVCWTVACVYLCMCIKTERRIYFLVLSLLPSSIQPSHFTYLFRFDIWLIAKHKKINVSSLFFRLMWASTKNHDVSLIFVIFQLLWISDTVNCRNWGSIYISFFPSQHTKWVLFRKEAR